MSIVPLLVKTETLRVQNVVDATRLGAWLRSRESIGWRAAGIMPILSIECPSSMYFVILVPFFLSFLFLFVCVFLLLSSR